jgi:hypothetical protein
MGLKCSPNFAQETLENIFCDIDDAETYIYDIGAFSPNWEHHVKLLCTILTKLQVKNGFHSKSAQMQLASQRNRLVWILVNAYRPVALVKEFDAVLKMEAPKTKRIMWFHRNSKLLPQYVASQSAYPCSINVTDRSTPKKVKHNQNTF